MNKTVLVTGASSGIGFQIVEDLYKKQYQVVAVVRKIDDQKKLEKYFSNIKVILADLNSLDEVDKISSELKNKFQIQKLHALINNAGVALAGPFLDQNFSEIQTMFQVNVLAVMKLTQSLLPLLGAYENSSFAGRIINISSVAGKSAAPFLTGYAASKHAIEGFSEGLRKEMMLFGIKVIVIGPGSVKTPIWSKGFDMIKQTYQKSVFASAFNKFISIANNEERNALPASEVSKVVLIALEKPEPAYRYAPIPRKFQNWYLPNLIPARVYNHLTAQVLGLNVKNVLTHR